MSVLSGLPLTGAPVLPNLNDVLDKDEKAKLSIVLARNGWGPPGSTLNRQARSIVKRESKGDPSAENPSGATGLFQVMTPLHCGEFGIPKGGECQQWLRDPDNNARAAKAQHTARGWSPWQTSGPVPPPPTSWDTVIVTDKDTLTGGVGEAITTVASPFTSVAAAAVDIIGTLLSADTWFRIGKGWLGFLLVIIGTGALVFIIANQASGGAAKRAARMAVTKGRA